MPEKKGVDPIYIRTPLVEEYKQVYAENSKLIEDFEFSSKL